jgi:hypothetical protein
MGEAMDKARIAREVRAAQGRHKSGHSPENGSVYVVSAEGIEPST